MSELEDLKAQQKELLEFVKNVDAQVEKLFDVVNNQDVPAAAAAELRAGLAEIKTATEKIATDDSEEPSEE